MNQIMKRWIKIIIFSFVLSFIQSSSCTAAERSDAGIPVDLVINAVRDALKEAQHNNIEGFPSLKEITLKLKTVASKSGGAEINFYVFSMEGAVESESVSEITLKMSPPITKSTASLQSLNIDKLNTAMAQAINTAKAGILAGNAAEPKLMLRNLTVKVAFAVKKSVSGGLNTADLLPVGLKGTGKLSKDQIHSVTLVFEN